MAQHQPLLVQDEGTKTECGEAAPPRFVLGLLLAASLGQVHKHLFSDES
jgi:hypothetical protein